ncbi:hypothetical protein [Halorubrum sp. DTA98]|uniref:hypothetical protein n=1 Tax=Halorubrum sp. DTA98 TaxID=3402163 RepID=UPI003AAFD07E
MEIHRAREDVLVAGAAAGTTVAIALLSGFGLVATVGSLATLAPLFVYFVYRFTRKGGPYGTWDVPRNWMLASLIVGVGVLVSPLL